MNSSTSSGWGSTSTANGQMLPTISRLSSQTARQASGKVSRPTTGLLSARTTGLPRRVRRGALPAGGASATRVMRSFLPACTRIGLGRGPFSGAESPGDRPAPAEEAALDLLEDDLLQEEGENVEGEDPGQELRQPEQLGSRPHFEADAARRGE